MQMYRQPQIALTYCADRPIIEEIQLAIPKPDPRFSPETVTPSVFFGAIFRSKAIKKIFERKFGNILDETIG
jgi:hypothetical protein